MRVFALAAALLLAGCAGPANDYTTAANAYVGEALDNTIKRRQEQNDIQLRAAEAELCGGVSIGAVQRRYATPEMLEAYLRYCGAVAQGPAPLGRLAWQPGAPTSTPEIAGMPYVEALPR